jgi:hypothetical protein
MERAVKCSAVTSCACCLCSLCSRGVRAADPPKERQSAAALQRFWHHAGELGRWWRSAVKSLLVVVKLSQNKLKRNCFDILRICCIFELFLRFTVKMTVLRNKVFLFSMSAGPLYGSAVYSKILQIRGFTSIAPLFEKS